MQNVSNAYVAAMATAPYMARLTLDGEDIIQGAAIESIAFSGGANGDSDAVTIGATVAGSAKIIIHKDAVTCELSGRELYVEFGIQLGTTTEWLPMGTYTVTEVTEDDGVLTVTANDALAAKFDVDYEPLDGFDFDSENGVDSLAFLAALCTRRGVKVDVTGLSPVPLKVSPEGYTERQIIGFIAALYGDFADIDRYGTLKFRWYEEVDAPVDADHYYESGMEKASYDFTVGWLKCYVEPMEETLIRGDEGTGQGIYLECPWMDDDLLDAVWEKVNGFTYRPVTMLQFFGDPRLDPGDIIKLVDYGGAEHRIPVMSITHEYDGGIITEISASGQAQTETQEGPVSREQKRLYSRILKKQNEIQLAILSIDGEKIISLINLTESEAYIMAPRIKLEGLVTANENFKVLEDGSIEAANAVISGKVTAGSGAIGGWKIDVNSLYSGNSFANADCFFCAGSVAELSIGGSEKISGWMIKAGDKFGVTKDGAAYLSDAHVTGEVNATGGSFSGTVKAKDGKIGDWNIGSKTIESGGVTLYEGTALYSDAHYEDGVETTVTLTPEAVYVEQRQDTEVSVDYASWSKIIRAANA